MANYSLVANTQFKARSFEDLIKPYLLYTQEYRAQEDAIDALNTEAATLRGIINEQTDPLAYQRYKSFEDSLNQQAIMLQQQGLSPALRASIKKSKARYASEVNPIKRAYDWKVQQVQNQAEGKSKGIVYEGNAATTSLDDYIANPTLIYNSADSNAGYTRVANAAQAIARGLSEAKVTGNLDKYTKALLIRSGYDPEEVTTSIGQVISDLQGVLDGTVSMNSKAGKVVRELLQNETNASGIGSWKDNAAKQEYISKVSPALYNLIGASQTSPMEDFGARAALQHSQALAQIHAQGAETRKSQDNDYNNKLLLMGNKSTKETAYASPSVYYKNGKMNYVKHDEVGNSIIVDNDGNEVNLEDLEQWHLDRNKTGGNKVTFRTAKGNIIIELDYSKNKFKSIIRNGDTGMSKEDAKNPEIQSSLVAVAKEILLHPEYQNQYTYNYKDGIIVRINNKLANASTGNNTSSSGNIQELVDGIYNSLESKQ